VATKTACAATYDAQVASWQQANVCHVGIDCCTFEGACGAYKVWREMPSEGSLVCVYDATGATFVASRACGDTGPGGCAADSLANCADFGTFAALALCDTNQLPRACTFDPPASALCGAPSAGQSPDCAPTLAAQTSSPWLCDDLTTIDVADCGDLHVWARRSEGNLTETTVRCLYGADGGLVSGTEHVADGSGAQPPHDWCAHTGSDVTTPALCTIIETSGPAPSCAAAP
jgi:hypothetical protein